MAGILDAEFIALKRAKPKSITKNIVDQAHSGKRFVRKIGDPQWWEFDLLTTPLSYDKAMALYAFICSQGGQYGEFYVPNPFPVIATNINAQVTPNMLKGDDRVNLVLSNYKTGDFIQFSSHDKVYIVTNVTESHVSFYPRLKAAVGAGSAINYGRDVLFKVAMQNDENDLLVNAKSGKYVEIKIDCVEVL